MRDSEESDNCRKGGGVSVIVPALDEAANIEACLEPLQIWRTRGHEVIVVDGGSSDDTRVRAAALADSVLIAARGRANQMNAGAILAAGEVFLFLHADSRLPADALDDVIAWTRGRPESWGRFDVHIEGDSSVLKLVAALMNWRSRLSGIATGDQGIFVTRQLFERVGRFPDQPLMEDIELSRRLLRVLPPKNMRRCIVTSGRRWEQHGVWRTIALMWRLRWAYFRGADPAVLASRYAPHEP